MLFKTRSAAVYGIDAHIIDVEVDFSGIVQENESFATVGLPDAAVRESRDRVRSAIKNSGFDLPPTRITINLAPADLKKEGSGFDLPIATGILGAYGGLAIKDVSAFVLVGELGLPAATGTEKESSEQSGAGQCEESRIHPRSGMEPGNDLCLLTVNDAHHRKFAQKVMVARLKDNPVIPTHRGCRRPFG